LVGLMWGDLRGSNP